MRKEGNIRCSVQVSWPFRQLIDKDSQRDAATAAKCLLRCKTPSFAFRLTSLAIFSHHLPKIRLARFECCGSENQTRTGVSITRKESHRVRAAEYKHQKCKGHSFRFIHKSKYRDWQTDHRHDQQREQTAVSSRYCFSLKRLAIFESNFVT